MDRKGNIFLNLTLLAGLAITAIPSAREARAANYIITQITDNNTPDFLPKIDAGQVVYSQGSWPNWDVFLYDSSTGTTTQLNTNGSRGGLPYINAGQVVWPEYDGHDEEVFLYDSSTGTTTQITDNNYRDINPMIDAGKVAWMGNPPGYPWQIFVYDIETGLTTHVVTSYGAYNLSVGSGYVSWDGSPSGRPYSAGGAEIFLYNSVTGNITQVTDNDYWDWATWTHSGQVVWQGWVHGEWKSSEVFLYDTANGITIQITNNNYPESYPKIDAGQIVWDGYYGNGTWLYDIATQTMTQTSTRGTDSAINAGQVVFSEQHRGPHWEIFLYDTAIGTTTQITDNHYDDTNPDINAGQVVWMGYPRGWPNPEIFLATPGEAAEEQLPPGLEEAPPGFSRGEKGGWEGDVPLGFDKGKKEGWEK